MAEILTRLLQERDIQQINDLYGRAYRANRSAGKFKWEFQQGPAGPAIYVVAVDPETDRVIGTQCAIPLHVTNASGEKILTAKSEDTLVDPAYRGRNIFEKMYALLFDECRRAGIVAIWGFTYAIKPFKKLGFDIPFKCNFGLVVFDPGRAFNYLNSLKADRNLFEKVKIAGLVTLSRLKYVFRGSSSSKGYGISKDLQTDLENLPPHQAGVFYLRLDSKFLDWRLRTNPYPNSHLYYSLINSSGKQVGSVVCSQSAEVSYIMHLAFSREVPEGAKVNFINSVTRDLLTKTAVLRFWGFVHNETGKQEVALLKKSGFFFTNQGISFVWKKLDEGSSLNAQDFSLSRMAAQGT
jgi:GNAT superfamily N-acetyltransferase